MGTKFLMILFCQALDHLHSGQADKLVENVQHLFFVDRSLGQLRNRHGVGIGLKDLCLYQCAIQIKEYCPNSLWVYHSLFFYGVFMFIPFEFLRYSRVSVPIPMMTLSVLCRNRPVSTMPGIDCNSFSSASMSSHVATSRSKMLFS